MLKNRKLIRQFIIDKKFQFNFLKYFFLLGLMQISVTVFIIIYFKSNYTELLSQIGQKTNDPLILFLNKQTNFLLMTSLTAGVVFLTSLVLVGLHLSQKIAGPIRKTINYLDRNEIKKLSFREDDYFHDLATAINKSREKSNHSKN